jgi:hypothetical protein
MVDLLFQWFNEPVLHIKTKIVSCRTAYSKIVKQEVNGTVILPPLVFPGTGPKLNLTLNCKLILILKENHD